MPKKRHSPEQIIGKLRDADEHGRDWAMYREAEWKRRQHNPTP